MGHQKVLIWVLISAGVFACAEDEFGSNDEQQDTGDTSEGVGDKDTSTDIDGGLQGEIDTSTDIDRGVQDETDEAGFLPTDAAADLDAWYLDATISQRQLLPVPGADEVLSAFPLRAQLDVYDPGSLLRCQVDFR